MPTAKEIVSECKSEIVSLTLLRQMFLGLGPSCKKAHTHVVGEQFAGKAEDPGQRSPGPALFAHHFKQSKVVLYGDSEMRVGQKPKMQASVNPVNAHVVTSLLQCATGLRVPQTGIYEIIHHGRHRESHETVLIAGNRIPAPRRLRPAHRISTSPARTLSREDFASTHRLRRPQYNACGWASLCLLLTIPN